MNLRAHHVRLTAFVQATESEERVLEAMSALIPGDIPEEDVLLDVEEVRGFFGNPIKVINVEIKRSRAVRAFLRHFRELLSEGDREYLLEHLDEKVDEEGTFYVRFNKQRAYLGEAEVDEGPDVVQVRVKVKAFPLRREAVVKAIEEWLRDERGRRKD